MGAVVGLEVRFRLEHDGGRQGSIRRFGCGGVGGVGAGGGRSRRRSDTLLHRWEDIVGTQHGCVVASGLSAGGHGCLGLGRKFG